jgi:hypothetical protein
MCINKVCDSINKVLNVRCFNRQYICPVGWTGVSTNDWYSNGYELCAPLLTHLRVKTSHCLKITELMYAQFWIFSHLL